MSTPKTTEDPRPPLAGAIGSTCRYCGSRPGGCLYCVNDPKVQADRIKLDEPPYRKLTSQSLKWLETGYVIGLHEEIARDEARAGKLDSFLLKRLEIVIQVPLETGNLSETVATISRERIKSALISQNQAVKLDNNKGKKNP